ncbi:hypothetical protein [Sinorhizobium meliloti]|uniref:Uncharacterized protein n=1 Tax=Sinorhizobium meliloti CCNWSX0020 TaxID=1107881 RepID=H0G861_RHIML|nr:hypothetical protein [Sinorhizobium meliloti]EHK74508.1 hypothetical protein SM0020_28490 [Sinorhizobium meliloti CCNWSX0020]PII38987.1 hypothetical protein T190_12465 [Sinorhizobium meliloti CCBAU 01290]
MTSLDRHFIPSFNPSIAGRGRFSCQAGSEPKTGVKAFFQLLA